MASRTARSNTSRKVTRIALANLTANARLNLYTRFLLMVFAIAAIAFALVVAYGRATEMVEVLTDPNRGDEIGEQLLALTAPVLLLVLLAGLAALAGYVVHSRGLDESIRTLDSVNRLRREDEVAVSARGLIVSFEEQLASVKRSHSVVLWTTRTLFIVTLGLFAACAIQTIAEGVDTTTVVLGATSLAGALLGAVNKIPGLVAHEAANVVQLQLLVTGAHRQIGMLESDAFAALNDKDASSAEGHAIVLSVQERIDLVVTAAVEQIQKFADDDESPKAGAGDDQAPEAPTGDEPPEAEVVELSQRDAA